MNCCCVVSVVDRKISIFENITWICRKTDSFPPSCCSIVTGVFEFWETCAACNLQEGIELIGWGFKAMSKLGTMWRLSGLWWEQQSQQLCKYTTRRWRIERHPVHGVYNTREIKDFYLSLTKKDQIPNWHSLHNVQFNCCSQGKSSITLIPKVDVG